MSARSRLLFRTTSVAVLVACSAAAVRNADVVPLPRLGGKAATQMVRIALSEGKQQVRLTSLGAWAIVAADGRAAVAITQPGERWLLSRDGNSISAMREDSRPVSAREPTLVVRPASPEGMIAVDGRRYRGAVVVSLAADGLRVVNHVKMDDYLKGVVPLELGASSQAELAALEAQAVTARSYAMTDVAGTHRTFDMGAGVIDQVYGGAEAERPVASAAVDATRCLVTLYGGQVVNAPYSSTCGGSTAEPQDVWKTSAEPYLRRVSDLIPCTTRYYCDEAPRFRWTQTFSRDDLRRNIARYMRSIGGSGTMTSVRSVTVTDVTPAGRVATLTVATDRGTLMMRGNEMRSALRLAIGEMLYSTYFSVDATPGRDGIETLTLHGGGNGQGVGMCQAGAIGRARAGQDFRTILRTYYPGTTVGTI